MRRIKRVLLAAVLILGAGLPAGSIMADDTVTIRVFSNLPDRTSGQGLVEQTLFDAYTEENPNVKIDLEVLDDEAYKIKFKAYVSGNQMPDLVSVWGQPGFLDEVMDAGLLAELNPEDYEDCGFWLGSLEGFSQNGRLYGLARNTDVMGVFYNKLLFQENGWEVPTTYEALIALCRDIRKAGYSPISMDGGDKWPLAVWYTDTMEKLAGDGVMAKTKDAILRHDFSDELFVQAGDLFVQACAENIFQDGFETTDYGTAKNLFTNGQAAMFYMGSWAMSMATDEEIPEKIRSNIGVFMLPAPEGGRGGDNTIAAWHGGGYSVTQLGANKEEAIKLLNYMFRPEGWNKLAWELGVCMSAQDFTAYATGEETGLQKAFMEIVTASTDQCNTPINDLGSSEFKVVCEDQIQELAIGSGDVARFLDSLAAVGQ